MSKPEDIPQDVWDAAVDLATKYVEWVAPAPADGDAEFVLTQSVARAILVERERCASLLVDPAGYFNPPEGYYEALAANTSADDYGGRSRSGDTGNWAAFFYEMLKPFAAAIRKGGQ